MRPGEGRDPAPLGTVIPQFVIDYQLGAAAAKGNLLHQWPHLVGDNAPHWKAHHFDEPTGTLYVDCTSDGWATTLRLTASQVIATINSRLPGTGLRDIKARAHAPHRPAPHGSDEPEAALCEPAKNTPVRRHRSAEPNAEYREQRERLRQAVATRRSTEPQQPTFEYGALREPEEAFTEAIAAQAALDQQSATSVRVRALAKARREASASAIAAVTAPRKAS